MDILLILLIIFGTVLGIALLIYITLFKKKEKEKHEDFSIIEVEKHYYDIRYTYPTSVRISKKDIDDLWYIVIQRNGKWYYQNDMFFLYKDNAIIAAKEILKRNIGIITEQKSPAPKQAQYNFGKLTKQQAADILGLTPTASADTVKARSRQLLLVLHPDKGDQLT